MPLVPDNPTLSSVISFIRVINYSSAASSVLVLYDWALGFGKEYELIWIQRRSLMTILYFIVRYAGILYSIITILLSLQSVPETILVSTILGSMLLWMSIIVNAMLGVIMTARLYAMYMRSRKILIFLVVIFAAITITSAVIFSVQSSRFTWEELDFSGIHQCINQGYNRLLLTETWILGAVWEILVLVLAVWVVAKHFRDQQLSSIGWSVGGCFKVLIKSQVFYFAAYVVVACLKLGFLSTFIQNSYSLGVQAYDAVLQIALMAHMFMLGPRLILSIREYHAELVAKSDAGTRLTTLVFHERVRVPTGGGV